jgi:peptidoglycan hydrolase CwlO-like protein
MQGKKIKYQHRLLYSAGLALVAVISFLFFSFSLLVLAQTDTNNTDQQTEDIQDSIDKVQNKIDAAQKEKLSLEQNLQTIMQAVGKTSVEIKKTQSMIEETHNNIQRKEEEIKTLNGKIIYQKDLLSNLIREMYYEKENPPINVILEENSISQMMGKFDYLSEMKDKMQALIDEINGVKNLVEDDKQGIARQAEDQQRLLALKQDQQQSLLSDKSETQSDINEKAATIGELQAKLGKLRSELSDLLGGSYDASDIEDAAKFAAKATGVRKDFILGMLVVESDLGRYTGGCYAKDSRMSGTRLTLFKEICSDLDYDWKKRKVSCPPKSYSGTGGAMGVAQFMSDTWVGYQNSIASLTGHKPPDPWNLTDGVTAMALKLAKVSGVTAHKESGECNAAKIYLSGTTSSKYNWYCQKVLYWADNYEKLLN